MRWSSWRRAAAPSTTGSPAGAACGSCRKPIQGRFVALAVRDSGAGIEPEALTGLKLSIPLPLWQSGSGKIAEKEAARKRMSERLETLRFGVQNQILLTHRVMSLRFRSAFEFGAKVLPAASEHIRECESAYALGEVDLQAVFRARDRLAEIELADLEARKAYFLAYSEWLGALGETKTNP